MEMLNEILPVLLYSVGIILLVVLTILGIRLIHILNKVDRVIDNVEEKVNSFNNAFDVIVKATDIFSLLGESVVGVVGGIISKIFNKNFNKEENFYE